VQAHVPRGRPGIWTGEALCTLLRHISDTREQNSNLKTRSEIYRVLVKRGAPYAGKKTDFLKHGHKRALNPNYNEILRMLKDAFVQESMSVIRLSYKDKGITNVPLAVEQKIKDIALDDALIKIGAPKGGWGK
jgi:hypothetical protein